MSHNRGVVFRGTFPSFARQFPDRLLYCRILPPKESAREIPPEHDILIDFSLQLPVDQPPERQRENPGQLIWVASNHIRVELNLLHREADTSYVELSPGFEDIVAPYEVNPLLTLSLYTELRLHLAADRVPGSEAPLVRDQFLPSLLTAALRALFGPTLGQTAEPQVSAAEVRFAEVLTRTLCERTYGDDYVTLMASANWRASLLKYRGALDRIDHPLVRCGQERHSGTKTEIAELFGLANPAFDNLVSTFPQLITVEEQFRGNNRGVVRFTLHPLEHRIQQTVERGQKMARLDQRTHRMRNVPSVGISDVSRELARLGYRQVEIDAAIDLLEARQMIQRDLPHGLLLALEPDVPSPDEVRQLLHDTRARLSLLKTVLDAILYSSRDSELGRYLAAAGHQGLTPQQLISAKRFVEQVSTELRTAIDARRAQLVDQAAHLGEGGSDDDRLTSVLSTAAVAGLFVDSLNVVRVGLLQELNSLKGQDDKARRTAREAKIRLEASDLGDEALVASLKSLTDVSETLDALRQRRESFRRTVDDYRNSERLLHEATALLNEKLLPLGSPVLGQRTDLDAWVRDVREALMVRRGKGLEEVESWRARFQAIRQKVDQYEHERKDEFGERQATLRRILTGYLQARSDSLPTFTYNPIDPEESNRLLVQQFRDKVSGASQEVSQRLDELARRARNLLAAETLELLPPEQREAARTDMLEVESEIAEVKAAMGAELDRLAGLVGPDFSCAVDRLEAQAKAVGVAGQPVEGLFRRVVAFESVQRAISLTPEEAHARQIMADLAARSTGGQVDFREFERRVKQEAPSADPWQLLRSLVTKSRVAVQIRAIGQ